MVQRATAQGATVILTTVFPTAQPSLLRRPFWSDAVGEAIVEVNLYLKTLAGDRVVLFDSAALLTDTDGALQQPYSYDLLHLNQAGYAALNVALRSLLYSALFESQRSDRFDHTGFQSNRRIEKRKFED